MPATTPNRGYPYPLAADPADVPQALEDLANAVEADLVTLAGGIIARRVVRVERPGGVVNFGTTGLVRDIHWTSKTIDNNDGLVAFPGSPMNQIVPKHAGFWFAVGQLSFNTPSAISDQFAAFDYVDIELDRNGTRIGRSSDDMVRTNSSAPQTVTLHVGNGRFMNGTTDYFNMAATIIRGTSNPNAFVTMFNPSMTLWQLTES